MAAGPSTPQNDPLLGRSVGEFQLEARIGAGATGVVYRGVHLPTGRPAAVKVLNDHLGRISSLERRFRREARVLRRLDHPNIVHIFEYGVTEDATFIAMELLEGRTLDQLVRAKDLPFADVLAIGADVARALAHAHAQEVVHRDLKPANVFLADHGERVRLLDFGLAKFLVIDELSGEVTLTRKGRVVGTPAYMAPEQITGVGLDARADIYAFGVMLFEMITGRRPFEYAKRSELLRAHLFESPPKLSAVRPDLRFAPAIEALLARALAKDPDERFPTAEALRVALARIEPDAVLAGDAPRPPRVARTQDDSSSVVVLEDELREAGAMPAPSAPAQRERLSTHPVRTPSAMGQLSPSTSTDESGASPWLWVVAVVGALLTGVLSYVLGSWLSGRGP